MITELTKELAYFMGDSGEKSHSGIGELNSDVRGDASDIASDSRCVFPAASHIQPYYY